ncbi:MAG TPA: alpha-L-fucosidase [Candidatus Phocaeicola excrementigallinarum]|nr:alpha-L-fucosidase [Candidatus Phocaeicola excrementigallinarum]
MRKKNWLAASVLCASLNLFPVGAQEGYVPSDSNVKARQEFADSKFGIFLHWGIYSMFAQGEWYLNNGNLNREEYAKAASGFYPAQFDADAWAKAFRDSGAKYICFTTRHHDGFSMFDTEYSDYDIMDATPFKRDIVRELTEACRRQGLKVHFYYSHIDWTREDYPAGWTGTKTGKDPKKADWNAYYRFMNNQLTELITKYGPDAIWFDGMWDQPASFDWQLGEQYGMIHRLSPACLIGNNHHKSPFPGEDFQMFERDLPGQNTAGLSGQEVSRLPLETCQTMNGAWGYMVADQNYKSTDALIRYLVRAAGKGANLLLNIGPQADGELPALALERLKGMGEWLAQYGETVYGTTAGDVAERPWGVTTRKGDKQYVHILSLADRTLFLPVTEKVSKATVFATGEKVRFEQDKDGVLLHLGKVPGEVDYIVELTMK